MKFGGFALIFVTSLMFKVASLYAASLQSQIFDSDIPSAKIPLSLQATLPTKIMKGRHSSLEFPLLVQPVVFHVLYQTDGEGLVPYSVLEKQIDQLNQAYSGSEANQKHYLSPTDSGIRFQLHAVEYIQNDEWHQTCTLPSGISAMRPQIALDPARYYNVYVCRAETKIGLSWLPYAPWNGNIPGENDWILGTVIDWRVLPGMSQTGKFSPWNSGDVLTHETGHHYGLLHPYQDGCNPNALSDSIDDTPRQTGNPFGSCQSLAGRDSCPLLPGKDDISNYMLATDDSCRSHFTPGQIQFMRKTIDQYKPTLKKQLPVDCVSAVDPTDKSPDLLPCIGDPSIQTIPGTSEVPTRSWCHTSKTNPLQWGWACCSPGDHRSDPPGCRSGTPTF